MTNMLFIVWSYCAAYPTNDFLQWRTEGTGWVDVPQKHYYVAPTLTGLYWVVPIQPTNRWAKFRVKRVGFWNENEKDCL